MKIHFRFQKILFGSIQYKKRTGHKFPHVSCVMDVPTVNITAKAVQFLRKQILSMQTDRGADNFWSRFLNVPSSYRPAIRLSPNSGISGDVIVISKYIFHIVKAQPITPRNWELYLRKLNSRFWNICKSQGFELGWSNLMVCY